MSRYEKVQGELRRSPKTWLVTGAAGFIGSHLVEKLLRLGQSVIGLDNFSTGSQRNLDDVKAALAPQERDGFRFQSGDICNPDDCLRACTGVDYVLHQAALGSVPRSLNDPVRSHQNNVDGFMNILLAARDAKVKRFVYASSSAVYGDHPALPKVEDVIGQPLSPYAATKLINEIYAQVFSRCYGLPVVGLRYFNVFGPRQDPNGAYAAVIPRWFSALLRGEEVVINGDGETSRDFCYVDNVVQANLLAAAGLVDSGARVVNIAVGRRSTLNALASHLQTVLASELDGRSPRIVHKPERTGDIRHSLADITLAQQQLGYAPTHTLEQGLAEARDWHVGSLVVV